VLFVQVDVETWDAEAICVKGAELMLENGASDSVFRVEVYDPDSESLRAEVAAEQVKGTSRCVEGPTP